MIGSVNVPGASAADLAKVRKIAEDAAGKAGDTPIVTTAGTGAAYTAAVDGITELKAGLHIRIVPHTVSTSATPTLNVNGLGAKGIRRRLSSSAASLQGGYAASWLASGKPFNLTYDGTYWVVEGLTKPDAKDLYSNLTANEISVDDGNFNILSGGGVQEVFDDLDSILSDLSSSVPSFKIEYGKAQTYDSGTNGTVTIKFKSGFTSPPHVTVTAFHKSSLSTYVFAACSELSAASVRVKVYDASKITNSSISAMDPSDYELHYIAMGI